MKINIKIISICIAVLAVIFFSDYIYIGKIKSENKQLKAELAHSQISNLIEHDTIFDSIPVASQKVITVDKRNYKKYYADKEMIKQLNISSNQIVNQNTSVNKISDTIFLNHNAIIDNISLFNHKDRWTEFHLSLLDSTFTYSVKDSIVTLIYREYKHRFLFLKWGTKGYRIKIINFNPHSKIIYNQNIIVSKKN